MGKKNRSKRWGEMSAKAIRFGQWPSQLVDTKENVGVEALAVGPLR